ncbi:hypothetical protein WJX74_003697 [Apatococcus lobatus]|uniref:DUF3445 domain-containing protein n=1 Tax=Apatococcus lobatus TaxID=904363 RepID=A0AAW1RBL0_9CHLO
MAILLPVPVAPAYGSQLLPDTRCSKRRRILETAATASRAQLDTEATFILDGQGRKISSPAVDWQTNSRTYAAFAKSQKPASAPFKLTMGLEPLHRDDWMEIDAAYHEEMLYKQQLLKTRRKQILGAVDCAEAQAACRETLEELARFLPQRFPRMFEASGSCLTNLVMGQKWDLADPCLNPLEVCSQLVQEDLCLMAKVDGKLRFVAGVVAFINSWTLAEKLGTDMDRIHAPVPQYASDISRPTSSFMDRLTVGRPFWRVNWGMSDNPDLFKPEDEALRLKPDDERQWHQGPVTVENAGERLIIRSERETLTRLPKTQAILFTIRTYRRPLSDLAAHPEQALKLAAAIRALPPDVRDYKGLKAVGKAALGYLDHLQERQYCH